MAAMNNLVAAAVTAMVAGCVHGNVQADIPADAQRVADRLDACTHFSGEFNGDGSERDREVNTTMTGLKCDTVEEDVSAIRNRYPNNRAVDAVLDAASQP